MLSATALAVSLLIVGAVLVRSAPSPDLNDACSDNPVACAVATNFVSSALLAAIVSVIWIGGFGQRRALRRYRRRITSDPAALLDLPVHLGAGGPRPRQGLTTVVLEELRSAGRRDPVVIEGDSGTGKSVTLCELARDLTERKLVPIVTTLRANPLTTALDDQVRSAFTSQVDRFLWSTDQTDRIWRRLRRSGRLVFLFDGLDEALLPDTPAAAEVAMRRFFDTMTGLGRTIVTCRPHVVPPSAACSRHLLPDLTDHEALALVRRRLGTPEGAIAEVAKEALARTDAGRCPLFADAIGQVLAEGGTLDDLPTDVDRARLAVLDRAHGRLPDDVRTGLGRLALALLHLGRYEAPVSSVLAPDPAGDTAVTAAQLEHARELGVVRIREVGHDSGVRFSHPILLAYFAAPLLDDPGDDVVDDLVVGRLPEARQALVWAALRHRPAEWIAGLGDAAGTSGRRAVTVIRICAVADADLPDGVRGWIGEGALPPAALQHQLAASASATRRPWGLDVLLHLQARSDHYGVRWRCAQTLAEIGPDPALTTWAATRAAEIATTPDVDRGLRLQEGLLWFGPSLAGTRGLDRGHWLTSLAAEVRRASEIDLPGALGAESSLAQGLKLAVQLGRPVDTALFEQTIGEARFWFARLEATLAIGLLADHAGAPTAGPRLAQLACRDDHPLVRSAGVLASRCWTTRSSAGLVWLNEHLAINQPTTGLAPETIVLLAETALLLNLSNNASQLQRDLNGRRRELPACLSDEQHRSALTGQRCPGTCAFGLCPYDQQTGDHWSRGVFPEAFCRAVRYAVDETGPPPWFQGSVRSYLAFWRALEREGQRGRTARTPWSTMGV